MTKLTFTFRNSAYKPAGYCCKGCKLRRGIEEWRNNTPHSVLLRETVTWLWLPYETYRYGRSTRRVPATLCSGNQPLDYVWDCSPAMDRLTACCIYTDTSSHSSTKTLQRSAQTAASPHTRGDQSTCSWQQHVPTCGYTDGEQDDPGTGCPQAFRRFPHILQESVEIERFKF